MKRFGYPRLYLHFHYYNPMKMVYLKHPKYGFLEIPKTQKIQDLQTLHSLYWKRM